MSSGQSKSWGHGQIQLLLLPTKNHRKGADTFLLKESEELGPIIQSVSGSENES